MSSRSQPDMLARLRAADPSTFEPDRGRSEPARAALQRILEDQATISDTESDTRGARRHRWRSRRGLVIVLATLLIGGAAFAATDPLGWWSANQGEARYGANPALHVRTPTIQQISCQAQSAGSFRCTAARSGQRYSLIDAIRPPVTLTRAKFTASIAHALAAGKISSAQARFRADLAAVSDSFFRKYQFASGSVPPAAAGSRERRTVVPPPGFLSSWSVRTSGRHELPRSQRRHRHTGRRRRLHGRTDRGLAASATTATELQPPARRQLHPSRVPATRRHAPNRDHEQLVIEWRLGPHRSKPAGRTAKPVIGQP